MHLNMLQIQKSLTDGETGLFYVFWWCCFQTIHRVFNSIFIPHITLQFVWKSLNYQSFHSTWHLCATSVGWHNWVSICQQKYYLCWKYFFFFTSFYGIFFSCTSAVMETLVAIIIQNAVLLYFLWESGGSIELISMNLLLSACISCSNNNQTK